MTITATAPQKKLLLDKVNAVVDAVRQYVRDGAAPQAEEPTLASRLRSIF